MTHTIRRQSAKPLIEKASEADDSNIIRTDRGQMSLVGVDTVATPDRAISEFNRKLHGKAIYSSLATHQCREKEWEYHGLADWLHEWRDRFDSVFELNLPNMPLTLFSGRMRTCLGYFLPAHNGQGMWGELAIRVPAPQQIQTIDRGDMLGTLLHELHHLRQFLFGSPSNHGHHNSEFRKWLLGLGLIVDYRGRQIYADESRFLDLLTRYGVEPPRQLSQDAAGEAAPEQVSGRSKLKKWSCGCTNVWAAVASVTAKCVTCDGPFKRA